MIYMFLFIHYYGCACPKKNRKMKTDAQLSIYTTNSFSNQRYQTNFNDLKLNEGSGSQTSETVVLPKRSVYSDKYATSQMQVQTNTEKNIDKIEKYGRIGEDDLGKTPEGQNEYLILHPCPTNPQTTGIEQGLAHLSLECQRIDADTEIKEEITSISSYCDLKPPHLKNISCAVSILQAIHHWRPLSEYLLNKKGKFTNIFVQNICKTLKFMDLVDRYMRINANRTLPANLISLWYMRLDSLNDLLRPRYSTSFFPSPWFFFLFLVEKLLDSEPSFNQNIEEFPLFTYSTIGRRCFSCSTINVMFNSINSFAIAIMFEQHMRKYDVSEIFFKVRDQKACWDRDECCSNKQLGTCESFISPGSQLLLIINNNDTRRDHFSIDDIEIFTEEKRYLYKLKMFLTKIAQDFVLILRKRNAWFHVGKKVNSHINPKTIIRKDVEGALFYELV